MKGFNDDKQMRSDWYIPICSGSERIKVDGKKAHSTQKPEALLYRVIISTSNVGDVVLDPFMGSGTTGAVAKKLRRNFIGIERESFYIDVAKKRINSVEPLDDDLLKYNVEIRPPRVPFGSLLEMSMVKVGDNLYSKDKSHKATILADSSLKSGDIVGSIHKVSAELLGKISNNGWTFWYYQNSNGDYRLIDEIRSEFINKYIT